MPDEAGADEALGCPSTRVRLSVQNIKHPVMKGRGRIRQGDPRDTSHNTEYSSSCTSWRERLVAVVQ